MHARTDMQHVNRFTYIDMYFNTLTYIHAYMHAYAHLWIRTHKSRYNECRDYYHQYLAPWPHELHTAAPA